MTEINSLINSTAKFVLLVLCPYFIDEKDNVHIGHLWFCVFLAFFRNWGDNNIQCINGKFPIYMV